uniref:Uncharacterized protein n=1 Tax=Ascaris lumbricoides TaxID=6252 RepID=A0A9J2P2P5_ASCLU
MLDAIAGICCLRCSIWRCVKTSICSEIRVNSSLIFAVDVDALLCSAAKYCPKLGTFQVYQLMWCLQIGDPLIKIIPAYRHRAQSSSCSSTTSGGGQQISPRLNNTFNGIPPNADHFLSRTLLSSISPIGSNVYSNSNRSASVTPLSGISSQNTPSVPTLPNDGNTHRDGSAMLHDPIQRTPLPPTSVDRAMMNAVLSQPLGGHAILDGACSPPVSSGRSSIVQDTPPPAAAALSSSKCEQPSNLDILASSASIVPLPSSMGTLIGSPLMKADISPVLNEKPLNNGTLITSPGTELSSPNSMQTSVNVKQTAPVSSLPKAVKRSRTSDLGDRPKRPRNNNKTSKSVKALLESVGPLISETVSDFQRERVSERDAAAAAAAASASTSSAHLSAPSTSTDTNSLSTNAAVLNNVQTSATANPLQTSSTLSIGGSLAFSSAYQPSTSTTSTASTFVGVPLLRSVPKMFTASDPNLPGASVDRHHVSTSMPSTSFGLGASNVQHSPFPQSMEELLERQWEQGSHFLMSHAPFDIAQLLSCLHELKMENVRLEESMAQLVRRRDHLLALNARLSLSLTGGSAPSTNVNTTSPHHSPRIGVGTGTSIQQSLSIPSSLASASCPASTSASSVATLSSGVVLPSVSQQQSHLGGIPSASTSALLGAPPYASTLPPSVDDSLNQLRSLAGGAALSGVTRNGPTSGASQLPAAVAPPVIGRPSSRQTPASIPSGASIAGGTSMPQPSQTSFSANRIPSASGHTSTTPTSAANASGPSGTSKSSVVSGVDLLTGSTAATISPERQQQLAAAAVAAAAANALGNSFLTARSPVQISTSGTGSNPLGQFASQDLLTQYALLAQHQILQHQAVAAAALSARYGGLVIPGSSTPPSNSSTSQPTPTSSHSGK